MKNNPSEFSSIDLSGVTNFDKAKTAYLCPQVRDSLICWVEIPDELVKRRHFRFSVIPA
jgi:hypothetical protein